MSKTRMYKYMYEKNQIRVCVENRQDIYKKTKKKINI